MIEWISKNKDWIFSGLGVAVLVWTFHLIRAFLQKKRLVREMPARVLLQTVIDSPPPPTPQLPAIRNIEPQAIMDAIEGVPLLQQAEVEKHYRGVPVEWKGSLVSAERDSDGNIQLLISPEKKRGVVGICVKVKPEDYPGLGLLKKGDSVLVSGKIARISSIIIDLGDCRLLEYGK